ncbi:MAG TPA: RagB/SusD family nutrient uptake outer membrane protein [Gemmatimonadales bacterium]|nr:RagB/SusD family nutrient uptake outer membrane protein [Gemmatimonadales bacterium]
MRPTYTRFGLVLAALTLTACSGLLDVRDPDIINPGDVQNADGAIAAYNGAIGDFAFANDGDAGGTEGQILVSGVMSDEYIDVETFPTRIEYDSRAIAERNGTLTAVYFNLHKARVALEGAASALQQYLDTSKTRIGEMLALAGFTYVYFAENYCSAVPFSERQPDGSILYGDPETTTQILDRAISRFDSALGITATPSILRLASVGKARALLDKGDFAGANTAAAGVTPGQYLMPHSSSTNRQKNGVFVFNNQAPLGTARFGVSDVEGTNGLNFRAAADPRVVTTLRGKGFDNTSDLYVLLKYTSETSPVPVATYVEARLIRAEAALHGATPPAAIDTLNAIRADAANNGGFTLAALADPGTAAARENLLFRERAFWLFATGHRLGDLRRLARAPYGRPVNTIYPIGPYPKGTVYGSNTELPVPFDERNNPNYLQAFPNGCDYNTP